LKHPLPLIFGALILKEKEFSRQVAGEDLS
jgi:hypothetical protein